MTHDAASLAGLALAFERRLEVLPAAIDASWQTLAELRSLAAGLPEGPARRRVTLRLFRRWCGPLPALTDLAAPAGRIALHERVPLLGRLCALALLSRPGVIRCCVERNARQALEHGLGATFGLLREQAHGGPPVPAYAAGWTPMQWACTGYADLVRARAWPHRSLRRLARLALPADWPIPTGGAAMPAVHVPTQTALTRLDALFAGEAPW
jgi:hypothetical protein